MIQNPNQDDYRKSHTSEGYGKSYHAAFSEKPYRQYVWSVEQDLLENVVHRFFNGAVANYLDFACGTGRILSHLERFAVNSCGIDISEDMLAVAKMNALKSEFYHTDLTVANVLDGRKFDLITSFRFFLNAQQELREEAMRALAGLLTEDGYLVFNIHNNTTGIANQVSKLYSKARFGKIAPRNEMSIGEVESLLDVNGLEIAWKTGYATVPIFKEDQQFPQWLISRIDALVARTKIFTPISQYILYVCRRK